MEVEFDPVNKPRVVDIYGIGSTILERFLNTGWDEVDGPLSTKCWVWKGSKAIRGGYGQINDRGTLIKTHRLSYQIFVDYIKEGMWVLHSCDNPPCVNPDHLRQGTGADNISDAVNRGRMYKLPTRRGQDANNAKLTWKDVDKIRNSKEGAVSLAKRFNVSRNTIWDIRKGKTWKK